jgi:hypothetical protein
MCLRYIGNLFVFLFSNQLFLMRCHRGVVRICLSGRWAVLLLALIGIAIGMWIGHHQAWPITQRNWRGHLLEFRADLRRACEIEVLPSESSLYELLMHPDVQNITIVFKPAGEAENPYYILQEMEIVPKLLLAYHYLGSKPNFDAEPVDRYEGLRGTPAHPIIALVHPIYSNETGIEVRDGVVFIRAASYEEFDLVVVKFLMVALDIEI